MPRSFVLLLALVGLAAGGCGGGDDANPRPAEGARPALVAALGDSITAGSPLWDPDPGVRERIGVALDPESQFGYWAQLELRGEATFRNCGVFGERTDQIAARLERCARGADILLVQGGINDIAQGRPVEDAAESLRGMVRSGRERGLRVALTDVLPWNNGYPAAKPQIDELNGLIARIAEEEKVPLYEFHDELEDPRRPGRMRATLTVDGDHPSVAGYRRLGKLIDLP